MHSVSTSILLANTCIKYWTLRSTFGYAPYKKYEHIGLSVTCIFGERKIIVEEVNTEHGI